jgi:hypothetical protein
MFSKQARMSCNVGLKLNVINHIKQHGNRAAKWHCGLSSVKKLRVKLEEVRKDYELYRNMSTLDKYCKTA